MCEYKSENDSLRMQLHGMKQLLSVSQSEDLAKELTDAQEKIAFFQSQYYQVCDSTRIMRHPASQRCACVALR